MLSHHGFAQAYQRKLAEEVEDFEQEMKEILKETGENKIDAAFLNPSVAKKILRLFLVPKTRKPVYNPRYQKLVFEPMPFEEWERDVLPMISPCIDAVIKKTQGLKEWIRATIFFVHSNPEILNEN